MFLRILVFLVLLPTIQAQTKFTVEQILSSPFPSGLTAAKSGNRVAWVFDSKGVRNVWVADGPDFAATARQITHYTADDGMPIASLKLTPDGKTILFARGSELNEEKESANPQSLAGEIKQQVFAQEVDARDAQPRLLGEMGCPEEGCEDIQVSPDGKLALWSAKKKIWLASVDGKQQAKELAFVRGDAQQPKWSPDGKQIAFVSLRGDHSFIAVYAMGGDSVRYISPAADKDSLPRWSPDGKLILFVRQPGDEQKLPLIPVRPAPWSIWIADATTGQGRLLWRSGQQLDDSFPELWEDGALYFAGDRVVFVSEQDGRNHLYSVAAAGGKDSVPAAGGQPTLLTPGDYDVEEVQLTPDHKWLIFTSNQDDVDRRHIWRVPVAGGAAPEALTRGETIEWSPVATGDGKTILCLGSSATTPAMPYVLGRNGRQVIASAALPKDFPSAALVTPEQVIFQSGDRLTLHGQLFMPRGVSGNVAGVVFMHGRPIGQMMLGLHDVDYYHHP